MSAIRTKINAAAIQKALDSFNGTSADIGLFYSTDNRKVYSCSVRLMNGNLAYGTGATVEAACRAAMLNPPIESLRAEEVSAA